MAWYWWALIIIVGIIVFSSIVSKKGREERRALFLADISTWQVGDKLLLFGYGVDYMKKAKENGMEYAILIKWDEDELMIDVGDGYTHLITHSKVQRNQSDYWRMKYASMDRFMSSIDKLTEYKPKKKGKDGKEFEVESKMEVTIKDGNVFIDGQPIEGMSEVYLNIYLKYALEEGNNKLAEKIRKELIKWR
jgi:hypothetical protein